MNRLNKLLLHSVALTMLSACGGGDTDTTSKTNTAPTFNGNLSFTKSETDAEFTVDLLSDITDREGDPLTIVNISSDPNNASIGAAISGNSITFTPEVFVDLLGAAQTETIRYSYSVSDGINTVERSITLVINGADPEIIKETEDGNPDDGTTTDPIDEVISVILNEDKQVIIGESLQSIATLFPVNADDKTLLWSVSDETIASVDIDGLVTTLQIGTTTITATASNGIKGSYQLTVVAIPVESISVNANTTVGLGQTVQASAQVLPANAGDSTVIWASSEQSIATVDANGLVTTTGVGETLISATANNGVSASFSLIVTPNVTQIDVNADITLTLGATYQANAQVLPENAYDTTVTWDSSDSAIASVDVNGLITAQQFGQTTITATAINGVSNSFNLTVDDNGNLLSALNAGFEDAQLTPWAKHWNTPTNAVVAVTQEAAKDSNYGLHINFDGTTEGAFDAANAVVGISLSEDIFPQLFGDGGNRRFKLSFDIKSNQTIDRWQGIKFMLRADEHWDARLEKGLYPWSETADNDNESRINQWQNVSYIFSEMDWSDVIAAGEKYKLELTIPANGKTGDFYLDNIRIEEHTPVLVTAVTLNGDINLKQTKSYTAVASISPSNADFQSLVWSSSDEAIATVDDKGAVTAIALGQATITATSIDGPTSAFNVNVEALNHDATITVGGTYQAYAPGEQLASVWQSSNPQVASVNSDGLVTALATGSSTITVEASGISSSFVITVDNNGNLLSALNPDFESSLLSPWERHWNVANSTVISSTVAAANQGTSGLHISFDGVTDGAVDPNNAVAGISLSGQHLPQLFGEAGNRRFKLSFDIQANQTIDRWQGVKFLLIAKDHWDQRHEKTLYPWSDTADNAVRDGSWYSAEYIFEEMDWSAVAAAGELFNLELTLPANGKTGDFYIDNIRLEEHAPVLVTAVSLNSDITLKESFSYSASSTLTPVNADFTELTWTSSDETVATVDSAGKVTAVAMGNATITATSHDGPSGSFAVTVEALNDDVTLTKGGTYQAYARQIEETLTWASSNEAVATVDSNGLVTALTTGAATITSTATDINDSFTVTVDENGNYLSAVNPDFEQGDLGPWETNWNTPADTQYNISADAAKDGSFGLELIFDGGNDGAANEGANAQSGISMAEDQMPQLLGEGLGRKFKLSFDIQSKTAVDQSRVIKFVVRGDGYWSEAQLQPWADTADANARIDTWHHVEYVFDEFDAAAEVASGNFIAELFFPANGTAGHFYLDNIVIEEYIEVTSVNLGSNITLAEAGTAQINATVLPSNADNKTLTWRSDDEAIASVDATGLITAIGAGSTTITATSVDGVFGTLAVTVEAPVVDVTSVSVNSDIVLTKGGTYTAQGSVLPANATDETLTWDSSDELVITIDANTGAMTAVGLGTATITASSHNALTNSFTVTVDNSGNLLSALNSDFETGSVTPWVNYWGTPEGAAALTVSGSAAKDGSYGLHFVSDGTEHTGISIPSDVMPQHLGQGLGRTFRLTYDVKLNNYAGSSHPLRMYFLGGVFNERIEKWHNPISSSDWTSVAIDITEHDLSDNGVFELFFIKQDPTQSIDAYFDNFVLQELSVREIEINDVSLQIADTFDADATVSYLPADAVDIADHSLTWESSDTNIATVDANGLITAVAGGTAVITATSVADGDVTTTFNVTVDANYLAGVNSDFEDGVVTPWVHYWETPEGASALSVTTDAAKDGSYGLHFVSDGSAHTGIKLNPSEAPQVLGEGLGRKFQLTYDVKLNNYVGNAHPLRMYFVGSDFNTRIEKWHDPISSGEWTTVTLDLDEISIDDSGRLEIYFIKQSSVQAIDAYFDNFRLIEVIE
ncbi:Ig-like domain-containing protein [Paraferrimonas sp. SM1919]|uniref:Ig-like domain-containing protein n=1 Tax=Paraferrimonas sp. SM1919 TaxID=2662263 RepID=UPI0013D89B34|nr:Ig-like domain-containing protein [Paraferrimonas sp. SM1919]